MPSRARPLIRCLAFAASAGVAACAGLGERAPQRQNASLVSFLYPKDQHPAALSETVSTTLHIPARVGIAFVPSTTWGGALPEAERAAMLERVRQAFAQRDFIASIEAIPDGYLAAGGGWASVDQVAQLFQVDVIALLSYDQIQFTDQNHLSLLYWTIVGAYFVRGDQYDIQTLVDASVFDVKSRRLLMRAPGTSHVGGTADMVKLGERSRAARIDGFNQALTDLIPRMDLAIAGFKERLKTDRTVQVERTGGQGGGGAIGWPALLVLLAVARPRPRRTAA
jgi:rhombotail lipoprotein